VKKGLRILPTKVQDSFEKQAAQGKKVPKIIPSKPFFGGWIPDFGNKTCRVLTVAFSLA
jgi:hypothetical protein